MTPRNAWNLAIFIAAAISSVAANLYLHTGGALFALIFVLAIFLLYVSIIHRIRLSL